MPDPSTAHPHMLKGLSIMAFAMMILPCMDAIAKYMSTFEAMSPGQVTFYRFFFQMVLTLPLLLTVAGAGAFRAKRPWMNLLRGVLHAAATLLFFTAVKYMPLADVFAIYFVEPFMLTAMSALILGEKVGWRRWLAIVIGFGGAMIVIQPSFEIFGATALLPVACAFLFALYLFLNRAIGDADAPLAMQTIAGLGGTIFMAVALFAMVFAFSRGSLDAQGKLVLSQQLGIIAVIAANLYVVFFNVSWGPVMWVMLGEMFPNQIRGSALAVCGFAQWFSNYLIAQSFPIMAAGLGLAVSYSFYAVCAVISFFLVSKFIHETKGVELEDMQG